MKISCADMKEFLDIIAGLVERGLTFEASASDRIITLTGGF